MRLALDMSYGGVMPADKSEMKALYREHVVGNPNFEKKGPFVKLRGWYTYVAAQAYYDPHWHG